MKRRINMTDPDEKEDVEELLMQDILDGINGG